MIINIEYLKGKGCNSSENLEGKKENCHLKAIYDKYANIHKKKQGKIIFQH